jgi:hypothetical protein
MDEEVDNFLAHYGVKGKAQAPLADGYSKRMYDNDRRRHGKKGAERINKAASEGGNLKKIREQEEVRTGKRHGRIAAGAVAVTFAGPQMLAVTSAVLTVAAGVATHALYSGMNAKLAADGRKRKQNMFADTKGIANYPTIRLDYNATTGNWI